MMSYGVDKAELDDFQNLMGTFLLRYVSLLNRDVTDSESDTFSEIRNMSDT